MFNATYFQYDGRSSSDYGLMIADFDDSTIKETDALSPTLSLQKTGGSLRFFHCGVEYDSAPMCEFSVLSETELNQSKRREVLSWLIGRNQFKALTFDGPDYQGLTYYCVFTSVKTIWVSGRCKGLRLTAQFDSPYARGVSTVKTVGSGTTEITLTNLSDIVDGYTYPTVVFSGSSISIINKTDDAARAFSFTGLSSSETITVDNEAQYISSNLGRERLSNFNKNWLRLRKGNNVLSITANGSVTITCPQYVLIGY